MPGPTPTENSLRRLRGIEPSGNNPLGKRPPLRQCAESMGLQPTPVATAGIAPTRCWCVRSGPLPEGAARRGTDSRYDAQVQEVWWTGYRRRDPLGGRPRAVPRLQLRGKSGDTGQSWGEGWHSWPNPKGAVRANFRNTKGIFEIVSGANLPAWQTRTSNGDQRSFVIVPSRLQFTKRPPPPALGRHVSEGSCRQ